MQISTTVVLAVPEQISKQARLQPHSTALHSGGKNLSYGELDRQANQFAEYLRQRACVSGGTVAICMERSLEWIVAALGIMRAGAAYVPLDCAWPEARLRFAVSDSGAVALVARRSTLERLQIKLPGIDPFRDAEAIASSAGSLECFFSLDSLAYVIYTSGSTGFPKGVEITHANLAHLTKWHRNAFGVTPQDRASHLAGLGFDAAVWEIWPNLCAGATVCLANDAVRSSPELIQEWMLRERVTLGFVPTVNASSMMEMEWPDSTSLRLLLTGGDALHRSPRKGLPFDVVNNYGPTECTVVATSSTLQPGSFGIPPIGRPIAGTTVYLLDEDRKQVPDGCVCEIYIGGPGVGRGYLNLSELTEQRFLPDPFAGNPMARLYRTGDRGVRRADGEIQFMGRTDRQVKIRGQRVELDEIGTVLSQHPRVDYAMATTHGSANEEKQLVAYILPKKDESAPHVDDLRTHLLQSLPGYMIPTVFVRLHQLPLSANGKCDSSLLPQPVDDNLLERFPARKPGTQIEEKVLAIVRDLLEHDEIGVEDNFFLAGGHSLLGMQLALRLREEFGAEVTLQQIFEAASVGSLALLVESTRQEERIGASRQEPLERNDVGSYGSFFDVRGKPDLIAARVAHELCSSVTTTELSESATIRQSAQLAHGAVETIGVLSPGIVPRQDVRKGTKIFWIHYLSLSLGQTLGIDQPVAFVMLTPEDIQRFGESPTLEGIAACFLLKIQATQPTGPYTLGGLCIGAVLAYEIAVQLREAGHEVTFLVLLDPPGPSYLKLRYPMTARLTQPRYLLKCFARLGLRMSVLTIGDHLLKRISDLVNIRTLTRRKSPAQHLIETAAAGYHPENYEGKVLLLLASERAPHVNFLPEWQALIPRILYTHYISGHHSDLLKMPNVKEVADVIGSHLRNYFHDECSTSR
jgi:amino acid adenylation domain-containing protein